MNETHANSSLKKTIKEVNARHSWARTTRKWDRVTGTKKKACGNHKTPKPNVKTRPRRRASKKAKKKKKTDESNRKDEALLKEQKKREKKQHEKITAKMVELKKEK